MAGMRTRLHAIAQQTGEMTGFSANFSGSGFNDMNFKVYSVPQAEFNRWVVKTTQTNNPLSIDTYAKIAAPSTESNPQFFSSVHPDLFDMIMNQFMLPNHEFYKRQANKLVTGV